MLSENGRQFELRVTERIPRDSSFDQMESANLQSHEPPEGPSSLEFFGRVATYNKSAIPVIPTDHYFRSRVSPENDDGTWKHTESFGSSEMFLTPAILGEALNAIKHHFKFSYGKPPLGNAWDRNFEAITVLIRQLFNGFKSGGIACGLSADNRIFSYNARFTHHFQWPGIVHQEIVRLVDAKKLAQNLPFGLPRHPADNPRNISQWTVPRMILDGFVWRDAPNETLLDRLQSVDYLLTTRSNPDDDRFPYDFVRRDIFPLKKCGSNVLKIIDGGLAFAAGVPDLLEPVRLVVASTGGIGRVESVASPSIEFKQEAVMQTIKGCGLSICRYFVGYGREQQSCIFEDQIRLSFAGISGELIGFSMTRVDLDGICWNFRQSSQSIAAAAYRL